MQLVEGCDYRSLENGDLGAEKEPGGRHSPERAVQGPWTWEWEKGSWVWRVSWGRGAASWADFLSFVGHSLQPGQTQMKELGCVPDQLLENQVISGSWPQSYGGRKGQKWQDSLPGIGVAWEPGDCPPVRWLGRWDQRPVSVPASQPEPSSYGDHPGSRCPHL